MTKFSIIVPVYNVVQYIRQCFESIQNQTFKDFEVLCVDDCGTDGSMDIVREFAQKDSRFKILTHEHNKGVSAARNTAIAVASGEYMVFVDSDDFISEKALEVLNNAFEVSNEDIINFGYYIYTSDDEIEEHKNSNSATVPVTDENMFTLQGCVWNKAYRTSKIKEYNIEFPVGLIVEDSEFTFKSFALIGSFYVEEESLYYYRKNREGSLTTEDIMNDRIEDYLKIVERVYDFLVESGLLPKFKKTMVRWLGDISKSIVGTPNSRELIITMMDKLLTKMNFPEAFVEQKPKVKFIYMDEVSK